MVRWVSQLTGCLQHFQLYFGFISSHFGGTQAGRANQYIFLQPVLLSYLSRLRVSSDLLEGVHLLRD